MRVSLTVRDFIDRAELVYGDRIGLVDEPDGSPGLPPGTSWGAITYRELARRVRAFAAGLDALGLGPGERVAIVSPNAARFVAALYGTCGSGRVLVPINFRLHAHEIEYIVGHSGARVLLVDPELDASLVDVRAEHRFVLGPRATSGCSATTATRRSASSTRTRRPRSTTRAAPRRAPRACSSPTATCGSTRPRSAGTRRSPIATGSCTSCRSSTATAGACRSRWPAWGRRR